MRRGSAVAVVATVVGGCLASQAPAMGDQAASQAPALTTSRTQAQPRAQGHTPARERPESAGGQATAPATPYTAATAPRTAPAVKPASHTAPVPAVWPRPQLITARGEFAPVTPQVTLVATPDADPAALGVIEAALRAAGARTVTRTADAPADHAPYAADPRLTVYAGAPAEDPLAELHAPAQADLPPGGYRLAVSGRTIALSGVGADGLFHAAQTLRQLAATRGGERGFAAVTVRDWPTAPVRGVAESFYGVSWTPRQRLAQVDFMARTKQNRFLYAPGDDPYRQAQWREPYPAAQRADLRALTARAAYDHVTVAWAVAPGQSLCFASKKDQRALERKLDAMWALGVRAFQLQFQDVSYSEWHCGADAAEFGSGPDAAARAQARVANATADHLAARYGDASPELSLLPTEFYQDGPTPYRTALAAALDPRVDVAWTGVGVLPRRITGAQVAAATAALKHPLLTVDNYPVNDFAPDRLFLGPYTGREPAVATVSAGVLASAMQQPAASRIPLFTAADYAWNPRGYDPAASWRAAIDDLAGTDPRARAALSALAGNESSSALNEDGSADGGSGGGSGGGESAYLLPLVAEFRAALDAGNPARLDSAAGALRSAFGVMRGAPDSLGGLADGTFGDEVRPWLDRLSRYGAAGEDAVDLLVAQAGGDGASAWRARLALDRNRAALTQGTATVGARALDGFLARAADEGDAWAGLRSDGRAATTTMASGRGTEPEAMTDGKDSTSWSSAAPPQPDDAFGVDLGTVKAVRRVRIAMGDGSGSDDFLHDAVLEVSAGDGDGWHRIGAYHDRATVEVSLPPGTRARQVRLRATSGQAGPVTVREFAVSAAGDTPPAASGLPGAAALVDGDLATDVSAAGTAGPVTVRFDGARVLDTVTVAAAPGTAAEVEVHVPGGGWRRVGALRADGWTELPAGVLADAVRLSDGAGVHEVVPWFAGAPRVTVERAEVDAEAGGPPVRVTVALASGLPRDLRAAVEVTGREGDAGKAGAGGPGAGKAAAGGKNIGTPNKTRISPGAGRKNPAKPPAAAQGVSVTAPARVTLRRGVTARTALTVRVPAGTAPGAYTVPVRFTVAGRTVERRLTVHAHPPTGGPDLVPGSAASSSGDETPDFPARALADGDPATRWSSPARDDAWAQVELPAPARVGRVVLHWQDAYAARYEVRTSADGVTWHTAATVTDGAGGRETVWLDTAREAADTRFIRVQGVRRATRYGYSLFAVEAYAVAG